MDDFDPDEPVFVVDLTRPEMERCAAEIEGDGEPPEERRLPERPERPVRWLALLIEGWGDPLLLPVEPTEDVVFLDALARIIRIAVLSGERMPSVAVGYGEELERKLAFEQRLPRWAYEGIDPVLAARLPSDVRVVLASRGR